MDRWRKPVVRKNLELAFPELTPRERERWVAEVYRNFARIVVDFGMTRGLKGATELEEWVQLVNFDPIFQELKKGPIIFVTAHFGNWELIPLALGAFVTPITIVGRRLDSPLWDREIRHHREQFNVRQVYKEGAVGQLIRELRRGRSIGILPDQNTAKREGVETRWFGKRVLQSPSPVVLGLKYRRPIALLFAEPAGPRRWQIVCRDLFYPTTLQEGVDRLAREMEREIRLFPTYYYWFHKRFKHFYESEYHI